MLLRSFKPAKCKTALNLAKSRMKLLKNKKEMQIKQMRRELAQLLQSGQDQTARIRVEHVAREEKMMVAYELLEIYCELIVARMPIIESQKNCPPDLKEAITSLIFAAQRCGDIPELQDISKNFTTKYGKEFAAAAIELRPQCGVCRTLVEKLSVKAPDAQMKLKILNAIAAEHDVKWEPKALEYEDPVMSMDLPGVALGDKVNKIQMESLDFLIPKNLHQHAHSNVRSDSSSQSHAHSQINDIESPTTAASHPSAIIPERSSRSSNQSSGVARSPFSMGRQNWKTALIDSTTAAEAAAESAERASAAARAAAEFAQRSSIMNVDSSGALAPSVHAQSEGRVIHNGPVLQKKHVELNSASSSGNQRSPRVQCSQLDANKPGNSAEYVEPKSLSEDNTKSSVHCESKRESYRESNDGSYSEAEFNVFASSYNQQDEDEPADNPFHMETLEMKNQSSSCQSQLSAFGDEHGIFSKLNEENYNTGSDYGDFSSFNHAAANDNNWDVKASCLSEFCDGKQDTPFKDEEESDTILELSDVFVSTSHRDNQIGSEDKGPDAAAGVVFDESGSGDEFNFAWTENSSDLLPSIKSSQEHSSFHQEHSHKDRAKQSFSFLPLMFDSHRESSVSEKGPENKKTSPDDVGPKLQSETSRSPDLSRWDEDAAFSPSPQMEFSKECQCMCSSFAEKPITAKGFPIQGPSNISKKDPSGDDMSLSKMPSHVHPKLPDFEALTAHMKSLRRDWQ